jgi:hypothetical protein
MIMEVIVVIYHGNIVDFKGSWGTGIGELHLVDRSNKVVKIKCETPYTIRELHQAYGNVITKEHTVNVDAIKNKGVYYVMNNRDVIVKLVPEDEISKL